MHKSDIGSKLGAQFLFLDNLYQFCYKNLQFICSLKPQTYKECL